MDSGRGGGGGGGTGGGGGGDAGGGGGGGGSFTGTCCLNGEFYACPDKAAFDKCAGFDVLACNAACGFGDTQCFEDCASKAEHTTHDPSACARNSAKDSTCGTGGGGGSLGCTAGHPTCTSYLDCGVGGGCNSVTGRCFNHSDDCIGTSCGSWQDCSTGQSCNESTHTCGGG